MRSNEPPGFTPGGLYRGAANSQPRNCKGFRNAGSSVGWVATNLGGKTDDIYLGTFSCRRRLRVSRALPLDGDCPQPMGALTLYDARPMVPAYNAGLFRWILRRFGRGLNKLRLVSDT